jgi:hypothetical protein
MTSDTKTKFQSSVRETIRQLKEKKKKEKQKRDLNLTGNLVEESNGVPFEFFNGINKIDFETYERLLKNYYTEKIDTNPENYDKYQEIYNKYKEGSDKTQQRLTPYKPNKSSICITDFEQIIDIGDNNIPKDVFNKTKYYAIKYKDLVDEKETRYFFEGDRKLICININNKQEIFNYLGKYNHITDYGNNNFDIGFELYALTGIKNTRFIELNSKPELNQFLDIKEAKQIYYANKSNNESVRGGTKHKSRRKNTKKKTRKVRRKSAHHRKTRSI